MKCRNTIWVLVFAICCSSMPVQAADKPNVLFILTDDLGAVDLSCYGSNLYQTPNLDRLASQGTRFTQVYTAAHVCSPTRASLVTGKFPARVRLTDWLKGHVKPHAKLQIPDWVTDLPQEEVTIAELLKPQGYATGWLGKWHLGGGAQDHGFDTGKQDWELNRKKDEEDPKGVNTLTSEAISFIEKNRERPFFLCVSHYAPHGPVRFNEGVMKEYQAKVDQGKTKQANAGYAAMIDALDRSIGQLLEALDKSGLADNTLVIFSSDNGGELSFTNNAPLRGGKGMLYEGGVRVPFIARWPGHVPTGKVSDAVICSVDLFPTLAALTGAKLPANVDGVDLTAVLEGAGQPKREALYWHYPHYHSEKPAGSIRKGDWKLIEWYETGNTELFNLSQDPYEQTELSQQNPQKTAELLADLQAWRKSIDAQMPIPNPQFDPELANLSEQQLQKRKEQQAKPTGKPTGKKGKQAQ